MAALTLDNILDALSASHQRATYGAVAALLGKSPRMLMRGCDRGPRYSWVVNRNSGKPTGYSDEQLHPDLEANARIIDTREELDEWMASHAAPSAAAAA